MKNDKKSDTTTPDDKQDKQIAVYVPGAVFMRLTDYLHDKYPGRGDMRSRIVVDAINEKLEREGY